ncbi:MAG TPA: MATE family efflux transporter [Sandaracinaceae bacterium LLY-WYZ-13_1]|nr:MATE family efflux transporter [Sandaracinaceae bacterium LLY-WYZ-13_1]
MSGDRSIPRRLWDLSLPVIGLNVLNVLALAVDTAMCGRLPDADAALTGLGFASQIVFLLMVAMMGLVVGSVALVSRAHGAHRPERVDHLLRQSFQLTVLLGLGVGVVGNLVAEPLLSLLGARGEALASGVRYLRPLLGGTVFYYLSMLLAAVLRGVGNTRLPFLVALGSNAINVVVNYGLILGHFGLPRLGVTGAAIGTVTAHASAVVALVFFLRRGAVPGMRPSLRPAAIDGGLASELFRVGAPAALDMVVLQASFLAIIGMLGRLDQVAVAAHGIGLRIQALAFVPGLSVSQATGAMVGNALGARDPEQARKVTRASVLLCAGIMSALAATIVSLAGPIVGVFDVEAGTPLASYAIQWMQLLGFGMPIVGVHIAFVGMLRGAGATRTSLGINAIATTLQIPGSYLLGFVLGWGAFGVWLAFPASFALKALLGFAAYRRGAWARTGARV